jgi:hypothetical protein
VMEFLPWLDQECKFIVFPFMIIMPYPVGVRFPLYSKGVDTYRFEYGVFLLNKNIEMVRVILVFSEKSV